MEVYESTKAYRYRHEVKISYAHYYTRSNKDINVKKVLVGMASELYVHDASDEEQNMKILGGPFFRNEKNSCNDKILNMINIMSI